MDSAKICVFGIACAIICVLIKHYRVEFTLPSKLGSVIVLFGIMLAMLTPLFTYFKNLAQNKIPSEYIVLLLKALGIGYMTQISSELCRDCGENSIGTCIEGAGKIEILILALPLINKIVEMSEGLMSW